MMQVTLLEEKKASKDRRIDNLRSLASLQLEKEAQDVNCQRFAEELKETKDHQQLLSF